VNRFGLIDLRLQQWSSSRQARYRWTWSSEGNSVAKGFDDWAMQVVWLRWEHQ